MKAIQTQRLEDEFNTKTEYMVEIDGKWHKVTCAEGPVLDGTHACSDNVYKWDMLGQAYRFKIEPCEGPEQELPKQVAEFLTRFKESGETSALLKEPREDGYYELDRYPGHVWGWAKAPEEREQHHRGRRGV